MFTKHILAAAAATLLVACAAYAQDTTPAEPPRGEVNRRIENQKDRIEAGVADDQLTRREAARVERHDKRIHAQEKKDRQANGGNLTTKEKRQLNRELNRNSREIARERHNNRKPKS
jgi:type IV pilus biogenesis protein CpaD/CtpE